MSSLPGPGAIGDLAAQSTAPALADAGSSALAPGLLKPDEPATSSAPAQIDELDAAIYYSANIDHALLDHGPSVFQTSTPMATQPDPTAYSDISAVAPAFFSAGQHWADTPNDMNPALPFYSDALPPAQGNTLSAPEYSGYYQQPYQPTWSHVFGPSQSSDTGLDASMSFFPSSDQQAYTYPSPPETHHQPVAVGWSNPGLVSVPPIHAYHPSVQSFTAPVAASFPTQAYSSVPLVSYGSNIPASASFVHPVSTHMPLSAAPPTTTAAAAPAAVPSAAAVVAPVTGIELSDGPPGAGRRRGMMTGSEPCPPGVDSRYWQKVYNRADSQISGYQADRQAARASGETYERALRLLVRDVVNSLDTRSSQRDSTRRKREELRQASLTWTPNEPIIQYLHGKNIKLAMSTWPNADQLPNSAEFSDARLGFYWKTDVPMQLGKDSK